MIGEVLYLSTNVSLIERYSGAQYHFVRVGTARA